jgi:hypothetical protein
MMMMRTILYSMYQLSYYYLLDKIVYCFSTALGPEYVCASVYGRFHYCRTFLVARRIVIIVRCIETIKIKEEHIYIKNLN